MFKKKKLMNLTKSVDLNILCSLLEQKGHRIDMTLVEDFVKIKTIEDNKRENDRVRQVIFKFLKVIFQKTNQDERFHHFHELVQIIYHNISQKLLELKQVQSLLTKEEYKKIVRYSIPFVKLEIILEMFATKDRNLSYSKDVTILVEELVEYLKQPFLLREEVYEIAKNTLPDTDKNSKVTGYRLESVVDCGGYLSEYAKLEISIDKECVYRYFIKSLPKKPNDLHEVLTKPSFNKELLFYKEFIPTLKQLGAVHLDFLPECYMVGKDFMVLKDLAFEGYSSSFKCCCEYDHLLLAIRQLAKMHSLSIIFEEKMSKILGAKVKIDQCFPGVVVESQFLPQELTEAHIQHAANVLKRYPHLVNTSTSMEELTNKAVKKLSESYEVVKKSGKYRNVLTHGDLWTTNLFYKTDSNKQLEHCVLLDYQLMRYAPQALDLLMLLHVNTAKEVRQQRMQDLLHVYYSELRSILHNFDIDLEKISPFNDLVQSVQELKLFGVFAGTFLNNFVSLPKEQFHEILKDPKIDFWCNHIQREDAIQSLWDDVDPEWKKKIEENAEDLVELCENMQHIIL
ncbi:uncharacterized protein LOC114327343 [Diabrotica virgifera virgifera]|uniref:CHK kinase-like domain-containing protein n=1 Tax=Diabrotica virgifera virgifera TaxID=50390 RepID=A0ABM5IFP4_DIAVI|nr:uncharacterized protein LOC114327343 [Diabrotica virgifera virgifera]